MPTLSYPENGGFKTPRIGIDVPDGWEPLDVPQTLLAARETATPEGGFATNLTIQHLVRPVAVTESILIDELRETVSSKRDGQLGTPYEQLIDDQPMHGVNLSYVDPAAGTLAQIHLFARHAEGEQASIVQLVLSFSGSRAAELGPVLRDIALSLKIDWRTS